MYVLSYLDYLWATLKNTEAKQTFLAVVLCILQQFEIVYFDYCLFPWAYLKVFRLHWMWFWDNLPVMSRKLKLDWIAVQTKKRRVKLKHLITLKRQKKNNKQ